MSLIGVINSDEKLDKMILKEFNIRKSKIDVIQFHDNADSFLEFLNFDMPELVIINLSDTGINIDRIIKQIHKDTWLHNFGIIGIFDMARDEEKGLLERLKHINILHIFDYSKIRMLLAKTLNIIKANSQIIFQRQISDKLVDNISGTFTIDNDILAIPCYANLMAICLFNKDYIDEKMKVDLNIALSELLINSIEHGNCKISYQEKASFLRDGGSIHELIMKKCKDTDIAGKHIHFEYDIKPEVSRFTIRDQGDGFDVAKYKEWLKKRSPAELFGRGILMARSLSSKLIYNKKGNQATILIEHKKNYMGKSPAGFSKEAVIDVKPGEIVFKEREESNFIYYIALGKYSVFHKSKKIGIITPADIFMGEMSFLLNNKRSATIKADTRGKLIKISKKAFISVIKKYPHYGVFLSRLIARKLARTNTAAARILMRLFPSVKK